MIIALSKSMGGGFHPADFEDELTDAYRLEYPYEVTDLFYNDCNGTVREGNIRKQLSYEDWEKWWRSNGDVLDIVGKNNNYLLLELPDNTDYKVSCNEGIENAYFFLNGRMWTDVEYVEYLEAHKEEGHTEYAPFQYENKYLEEPER